jgi:hypothetical protein
MPWLKTNIRTLDDLKEWEEVDTWEEYCERGAWGYEVVVDPLEHLPKRLNHAKYLLDRWRYYYHYYKIKPYVLANRIIEKNIGKPYDSTYSYYLKKFPANYSIKDIVEAWDWKFAKPGYWRTRNWAEYYVDDEGLIQVKQQPKSKIEINLYNYILATENDLRIHPYKCIFDKSLITGRNYITFNCKDYQYYRAKSIFLSKAKKLARQEKLRKSSIDYNLILKQRKHEQRINKTISRRENSC